MGPWLPTFPRRSSRFAPYAPQSTPGGPMTFDLLVIGDANPDVVVGPVDQPILFGQRERLVPSSSLVLGGSASIMACGAAQLGLSVAFAGRVGDDPAGD